MSRFAPFRGGSYAARRPQRSPQQLRADWADAVRLARSLAATAAHPEGAPASAAAGFGQGLTRLAIGLRDLDAGNFPVAAESARSMAAAFLKLARDFCHPGWSPEARTACAGFLAAGAEALDAIISELRARDAEAGRRVLGEREEEEDDR